MKATVSFATKARWSDAWPGRLQRLDRETARLERALDDLDAVALDELGVAGDVVGVRVRRQQVRHVQALALDDLVQRLERRAAVDEDRRPAGLVREQVRVREPVGMHAPLDQHRETVTPRERIAAREASSLSGCARSREPRAPGASSYGACGSVGRGTAGTGNGGALAPAAPAAPVAASTTSGTGGSGTGSGGSSDRRQQRPERQRQRRRHLEHARPRPLPPPASARAPARRAASLAVGRDGAGVAAARVHGSGSRGAAQALRPDAAAARDASRGAPTARTRTREPSARRLSASRGGSGRRLGDGSDSARRSTGVAARPAACGTGTATLAPAIVSTVAPSAPAARGVRVATSSRDHSPTSQPGSGGRKTGRRDTVGGSSWSRSERRARKSSIWTEATVESTSVGDLDVGEPDDLAEHEDASLLRRQGRERLGERAGLLVRQLGGEREVGVLDEAPRAAGAERCGSGVGARSRRSRAARRGATGAWCRAAPRGRRRRTPPASRPRRRARSPSSRSAAR